MPYCGAKYPGFEGVLVSLVSSKQASPLSRALWSGAANALFALSSLVFAFFIAWFLLARVDFLYPVWHDHTRIGAGIDQFGPKNRFKPGFGDTDRAQRVALFHQINVAVHRGGEGLTAIYYETPTSVGPQRLLREPEIVHLVDVANLIDFLKWVVALNALLWLGLLAWFRWGRLGGIRWRWQGIGLAAVALLAGLILLIAGPVKVFNTLHVWIFPDEHQWFFYYQESLMSTLMLAPVLFGWIAAALSAVALPLFVLLVEGGRRISR